MYFKKVLIAERLPEKGKFVTVIDIVGNHRVFRLTDNGWNMRDADGDNSPNNNLEITSWLEEVDMSTIERKATKWDELGEKIAKCYESDEDDDDSDEKPVERMDDDVEILDDDEFDGADLVTIGELAATAYGWL